MNTFMRVADAFLMQTYKVLFVSPPLWWEAGHWHDCRAHVITSVPHFNKQSCMPCHPSCHRGDPPAQGWAQRAAAGHVKARKAARASALRARALLRRGMRAWLRYYGAHCMSAPRKAAAAAYLLRRRLRRWRPYAAGRRRGSGLRRRAERHWTRRAPQRAFRAWRVVAAERGLWRRRQAVVFRKRAQVCCSMVLGRHGKDASGQGVLCISG